MTIKQTRESWLAGYHARLAEIGECLEWTGDMRGAIPVIATPAGYLVPEARHGKQSARTLAWLLKAGSRPKAGYVVSLRCGNNRCLHPDHLMALKRGEHVKLAAKRDRLSTPQRQSAALVVRDSGIHPAHKLSLVLAREIRNSSASAKELAQQFGVSCNAITSIRRGATWRESSNHASVFSWRPAA